MLLNVIFVLFSCLGGITAYFILKKIYQDFILKYQKTIKKQAQQGYLLRQEACVIQENLSGTKKEKGLLFQLDHMLDETGLRRKWNYLTAEIYLLFLFFILIVLAILIYFISQNVLAMILGLLTILLFHSLGLYVLSGYFYKKTEKQLLIFINLLDNYSKTSDDLVEIIGKTEMYLEEPLKSAISEFHWEAVHTGDIDVAIRHLTLKLSHSKLQEIIRNLDICRKHEANYTEIINDVRISIKEYLAAKEERKSIYQNARAGVVIMMIVGILILRLVNGFIEGELWRLMLKNKAGLFILFYLFAVLAVGIRQFIKIDRS